VWGLLSVGKGLEDSLPQRNILGADRDAVSNN